MTRLSRGRGYVLLTALGFLSLMTALAFNFQSAMEVNVQLTNGQVWSHQARYVAAGGVAEARAVLDAGEDVAVLAQEHPLGAGLVRVDVRDLRSQLHLNLASAEEVAALLQADVAAVRRHRPFGTVHDVQGPLGLSADLAQRAVQYGTVHGDGGLHFDQVPAEVLAALGGISPAQVDALVRHRAGPDGTLGTRDDVSVNSAAGLAAVPGIDADTAAALAARIGTDDGWRRVHAAGRAGAGGHARRARVEAVVHRTEQGWVTVQWVEKFTAS